MTLFRREWGRGAPVIALHPLGLDSSGFAGLASALAARGLRTVALDLPGFGRTPALAAPPTARALAEPVLEVARELDEPPVVLGISLGGRVALEAALLEPALFRSLIAIAPALPWVRFRALLGGAHYIGPELADWLPLERGWPVLRWLAGLLESMPVLRDDEIARAGARLVYYLSCPATRASFLATTRELALDPAFGDDGLWTRLPGLALPSTFVWGERDLLISKRYAHHVARALPGAQQLLLPCVGHWLNGAHHRCLAAAVVGSVREPDAASAGGAELARLGAAHLATHGCVAAGPGASLPCPEAEAAS